MAIFKILLNPHAANYIPQRQSTLQVMSIGISRTIIPFEIHARVSTMYSWLDVTKRTEIVYNNIAKSKKVSFVTRLVRYR
jgi:hypothetical protein